MSWNLDSQRPIYAQIIERVQLDIITGRYAPGSRLPSVRELAAQAAVNPNTMQKALSELESGGLIYAHRTSGRFVTEGFGEDPQGKRAAGIHADSGVYHADEETGTDKEEIMNLFQQIIGEEVL